METLTLNLSESNTLEFETEIQGITSEKIEVWYNIVNEGVMYSFSGQYNNGVVTIDLPILTNMFEAKTYESKLTFIVEGNRYFEPMHVLSEMVQPVTITSSVKESTTTKVTKQDAPVTEETISVSAIKVTKQKDIMERMSDALVEMKDSKNLADIISIYKKNVLLNENSKVTQKEALDFINTYCKSEHGKSFKDYIK